MQDSCNFEQMSLAIFFVLCKLVEVSTTAKQLASSRQNHCTNVRARTAMNGYVEEILRHLHVKGIGVVGTV